MRLGDDRWRNTSRDALRLAERRADIVPSHACCLLAVSVTMADSAGAAGAGADAPASATNTAAAAIPVVAAVATAAGDAVSPSGAGMEQVIELFQNQRQRKFKVSSEQLRTLSSEQCHRQ